jgi:amidohydrolase
MLYNVATSEKARRTRVSRVVLAAAGMLAVGVVRADPQPQLDELTAKELPSVIAWRRDLHQHPELGNREARTAKIVADHLRHLGLKVQAGVAHTGVVALLEGGRPGPTVAVRADMDALPVTEKTDVPFRSHATASYRGETVGVMHACGHDAHTAMLMGLAEELTRLRATLPGNVLFIFQPAEEGAPEGEEGGAQLMLKEGLLSRYRPDVVFGLHVWSALAVGDIGYRSGPLMAAVDSYKIHVQGRQAHGSRPWQSIDPIVTSAQIVNALQTVVSRDVDITAAPAVVSVGAIKGGIRSNIIPAEVELLGTIRTFTEPQRTTVLNAMKRIIESTAAANGASAQFILGPERYPVTYNDPKLMARVLPSLQAVVGAEHLKQIDLITAAEDFSFFAQAVPGVYFFVGVTPPDQDPATAPSNHSDYFYLDERGIPIGMRAMSHVVVDYLNSRGPAS